MIIIINDLLNGAVKINTRYIMRAFKSAIGDGYILEYDWKDSIKRIDIDKDSYNKL